MEQKNDLVRYLESIFSSPIYRRGVDLAKSHKFNYVKFEKVKDNLYGIDSSIIGSVGRYTQDILIDIDESKTKFDIVDVECDCPYDGYMQTYDRSLIFYF